MADYLVAPVADDLDTAGFFRAAADNDVAVLFCGTCDAVLHLPRAYCRHCGAFDPQWRTVEPSGTVYSFSVITHQVHPDFDVPYTVVLVELDAPAGVRLIAHLPGRPDVRIGQGVVASFVHFPDGVTMPNWALVPDQESG